MFGLFKRKKKPEAKPELRPYQVDFINRIRTQKSHFALPLRAQASAPPRREDDNEDFALSMAVGMATHNALLGMVAGGSVTGGLVGASLSESLSASDSMSSTSSSSNCDSGSSYDTGSSFDSGSCGGSDSGSW